MSDSSDCETNSWSNDSSGGSESSGGEVDNEKFQRLPLRVKKEISPVFKLLGKKVTRCLDRLRLEKMKRLSEIESSFDEKVRKVVEDCDRIIGDLNEEREERKREVEESYESKIGHVVDFRAASVGGEDGTAERLRDSFECPICMEMMLPPRRIMMCVNGHSICDGCHGKEEVQQGGCPSCRDRLAGRNTAMENLRDKLFQLSVSGVKSSQEK